MSRRPSLSIGLNNLMKPANIDETPNMATE
jgi:hypothetical protein